MKTCSVCGQSIDDNSLFCPYCGSKADAKKEERGVQEDMEILQVTQEEETVRKEEKQAAAEPEELKQQDFSRGSAAANPYMAQPMQPQVQSAANPYMAQQAQPQVQGQDIQAVAGNPYMAQPQMMAQPSYYAQANANIQGYKAEYEKPLSVGEWMLTLIIMSIPIASLIMMFVWGFGEGNTSRKNFCRAYLIFVAIMAALMILWIILIVVLAASSHELSHVTYY